MSGYARPRSGTRYSHPVGGPSGSGRHRTDRARSHGAITIVVYPINVIVLRRPKGNGVFYGAQGHGKLAGSRMRARLELGGRVFGDAGSSRLCGVIRLAVFTSSLADRPSRLFL